MLIWTLSARFHTPDALVELSRDLSASCEKLLETPNE